MDRAVQIVAVAGSNRKGSLNRLLLRRAVEALEALPGVAVDVVDLRDHPLPLYDADQHAAEGLPADAVALHERFAAADAVVFSNPEYNGGYPALWKNAIDWVSRIDMLFLHTRYVGLLSASPGRTGGTRGIEHTRGLLANMFVPTHPDGFPLAGAHEALTADGFADPAEAERMAQWAAGFVEAARAHAEERDARAA